MIYSARVNKFECGVSCRTYGTCRVWYGGRTGTLDHNRAFNEGYTHTPGEGLSFCVEEKMLLGSPYFDLLCRFSPDKWLGGCDSFEGLALLALLVKTIPGHLFKSCVGRSFVSGRSFIFDINDGDGPKRNLSAMFYSSDGTGRSLHGRLTELT